MRNDVQPPQSRMTTRMTIIVATVLACVPIVGLAQFISLARADEHDAWLFSYYGRRLLEGARLYADIWDNKPPGIFWINAIGLKLAGGSQIGVWALCSLAVAASVVVVFCAARRLYGWAAAGIAAALAAIFLNLYPYHVGCDRPNTLFVLTELACFALYVRVLTGASRGGWSAYGAGVCGAISLCFKQTGLAASAAVVVHCIYLLIRRPIPVSQTRRRLILFVGGWCSLVMVAALAVAWRGSLAWAWDAIVGFNREYFRPGGRSSFLPDFTWAEPHFYGLGLPLILALATLVHPVLRRIVAGRRDAVEPSDARLPPGLLFMLWVWLVAAVYLALLGPSKRVPYLAITLPPLIMLSAHSVHLLLASGRVDRARIPAYHVVVGVLWFLFMVADPLHMQVEMAARQYYHRFLAPPDQRIVAAVAAIRRYTAADEAIFVTGYRPDLYWLSERPSAIRYIGTDKVAELGQNGQPLLDTIVQQLEEVRPRLILTDSPEFKDSLTLRLLDTSGYKALLDKAYMRPDPEQFPTFWLRRD